jgi:glycosyltransferase involved in cell wall biosynthesis
MRIVVIIQCLNLGGMEQATARFIGLLKLSGSDHVTVISPHPEGDGGAIFRKIGCVVTGFPYIGPFGIFTNLILLRKIWSLSPDCIWVVGSSLSACISALLSPAKRKILSLHSHHTGVYSGRIWKIFYHLIVRIFDIITYPSNIVRDEAINLLPRIEQCSFILRNPIINTEIATNRNDKKLQTSKNGHYLIGNAGWLITRKRWDVFLECCAKVMSRYPHVRALIAGDGPERAQLEERARMLAIHHKITWLGWVQDLSNFYSKIDVLLFNSDADAFGLTPIEAMAQGIPVVISCTWGGISEAIPNDRLGYLLGDHDIDKLSNFICALVEHPERGREMGFNGREFVLRLCDNVRIHKLLKQFIGLA